VRITWNAVREITFAAQPPRRPAAFALLHLTRNKPSCLLVSSLFPFGRVRNLNGILRVPCSLMALSSPLLLSKVTASTAPSSLKTHRGEAEILYPRPSSTLGQAAPDAGFCSRKVAGPNPAPPALRKQQPLAPSILYQQPMLANPDLFPRP